MKKIIQEIVREFAKLSTSGQIEVLTFTKTVSKAEYGIKKQYGLNDKTYENSHNRKPVSNQK